LREGGPHGHVVESVNVRGVASPAHWIVQVEVSRHSIPQLSVHTKSHVEPPSQVALELAPIVISQVEPPSQVALELSPIVTSQIEPWVHV